MYLPQPKGIQIEVLDLPTEGHNVVLGTAGSGKTTLAIYRAVGLSKINRHKKILLITFNKTLVKYLNAITKNELPSNIDVVNYHKFARGYLNSRGKIPSGSVIVSGNRGDRNSKLELISDSIRDVIAEIGENSTLKRDKEVFLEEINWIEKMGIRSLKEYQKIERVGRLKTRIKRENRKYFYMVYQQYLRNRKNAGYEFDWEDMATFVYDELLNDNTERMYNHIVIDEGQDLSPMMLKSLVEAIPKSGSITYFGDVAQQIYGSRLSWRDAGLNLKGKKIWKFDRNYRNSKEIAQLAIEISKSPYFSDEIDLVEPIVPTASSPKPALIKFDNEKEEFRWIIEFTIKASEHQSVAILVRDRETVSKIESKFIIHSTNIQILKNGMDRIKLDSRVSVGTYHSAKGLEFDMIILPFCSNERLPKEDTIIAFESREEALKEEIKLMYVAVTRARRGLVISYSGMKTELLPDNKELYDERKN